jgi:hypothetical protein
MKEPASAEWECTLGEGDMSVTVVMMSVAKLANAV